MGFSSSRAFRFRWEICVWEWQLSVKYLLDDDALNLKTVRNVVLVLENCVFGTPRPWACSSGRAFRLR